METTGELPTLSEREIIVRSGLLPSRTRTVHRYMVVVIREGRAMIRGKITEYRREAESLLRRALDYGDRAFLVRISTDEVSRSEIVEDL